MDRQIYLARNTEKLENPSTYNEGIRNSWMPFWTKNSAENYARIKAEFMKESRDAAICIGKEHHDNVLLIGSGPSLNDWEPYFKDWEGDIICSSSHLVYFEAIGVKPTMCFIIDADPSMTHLVTEADTKDITLVTHPNMDPVILREWQGPIAYFRMFDPGDSFFKEVMPMQYSDFMDYETKEQKPGIRSYVLNSGNVTNSMIAMCSGLWHYKNVFLCGVDLGFPKGEIDDQYRFIGYKRKEGGFEREEPTPIPKERIMYEGNNGVKTDQVSCFYKYSTMILWGMDNPNIYSCSRGILTEIPYISPQDVLACQGDIPDSYIVPNEKKYDIAQQYLRYRGIYIMKGLPRVKKMKAKNYKKTKKRLMRYQVWSAKLFGTKVQRGGATHRVKYNPQLRKHIIHTMHSSPAIRFRFYLWDWMWTKEGEKTRTRLAYTAITNKYSEKGKIKRLKLTLKFHLGRLLGIW